MNNKLKERLAIIHAQLSESEAEADASKDRTLDQESLKEVPPKNTVNDLPMGGTAKSISDALPPLVYPRCLATYSGWQDFPRFEFPCLR